MFSFVVCTLTESNEPQLVRQVQPWWILLSACNVVKQQSLSLGGSREKCGDTFGELPKCPWARRRTLKWSAFEASRIPVPYGHVFIVWSHICVVCNKHQVVFGPGYSSIFSKFFPLFIQWKNNYVLCQHKIWTFWPTHCPCYTQLTGIFFLVPCLDQKGKKGSLASYTNKRWWMSRCSINLLRGPELCGSQRVAHHSPAFSFAISCFFCYVFMLLELPSPTPGWKHSGCNSGV